MIQNALDTNEREAVGVQNDLSFQMSTAVARLF